MNIEKILKVAEALEELKIPNLGFDMEDWVVTKDDCGTVACIAGWTVAVLEGKKGLQLPDISGRAAKHLGIENQYTESNRVLSSELFMPPDSSRWGDITPAIAAQALRNLAEHGDPKWDELAEEHDL